MPQLLSTRNFNLKVIFLVHFIFIALSTMGSWNPLAFLFYNFLLILFLVWSIYNTQNEEPVQLAIVVNGVSIILDILLLVMCYPESSHAREKFSAAMCILHLITRPFSVILLSKNLEERTGTSGSLGNLFGGSGPNQSSSYEDIDRGMPPPATTSQQNAAYDFKNAQQI